MRTKLARGGAIRARPVRSCNLDIRDRGGARTQSMFATTECAGHGHGRRRMDKRVGKLPDPNGAPIIRARPREAIWAYRGGTRCPATRMARTLHGAHGVHGGMLRGVGDAVPHPAGYGDSSPTRCRGHRGCCRAGAYVPRRRHDGDRLEEVVAVAPRCFLAQIASLTAAQTRWLDRAIDRARGDQTQPGESSDS